MYNIFLDILLQRTEFDLSLTYITYNYGYTIFWYTQNLR